MVTSYTFNEITFSNVSKGIGLPNKYGNRNNGDFTRENSNVYEDGIKPFVNAIEIDWNGAGIANTTVNTTGELLKIINDLYGKVNNAKVSSIQLSYTSTWEPTWVSPDTTLTVYAYVYPDNAYNKNVQWECINAHTVSGGNNELITFDSAYESYTTITLKDYGKGTVRCTAQDGSGVYGQFNINAHPPVVSNTITATLLYGEGVDGGSEYVTPAQIEKAREFTNISVNLASLDNYSEFHCPGYTTSHSLIIRLPYSESNTGSNIYPSDVQFKDTTIQETNNQWRDIGYLNSTHYNEQQIKTHYTSNYSYFVLTSYEPGKSDYRVNFTKVKPNYGNVLPDPT